ncbi:MAG: hypothetical protein JSS60_06580 [Verrucomicrobia bacterium]|nr:hypothetical protein [Verrucomicrobiota bacterium]
METKIIDSPLTGLTSVHPSIPVSKSQADQLLIPKQPFIDAIMYIRDLFKKALEATEESTPVCSTCGTLLTSDTYTTLFDMTDIDPGTFHFGMFLYELQRMKEEGTLLPAIQERRSELHDQKEHWRAFIEQMKIGKDKEFYDNIQRVLKEGKLIANGAGAGSCYFVVDADGKPCYVIKPVDEDIFCLNNRKELGGPFNDAEHRVRDDIPLYRSAQTDAFCWEVASMAGLGNSTPRAVMGIVENGQFYDFTIWLNEKDRENFLSATGFPDREKLCSIQEFIPESQDLFELLHEFYTNGLSDDEIASRFDQNDFEQTCMFLWLSYDNDGHGGNFRTYVKRIDETGKKIYGIKKIDNGLSFPEKNTNYFNMLAWSPNAVLPISDDLKQKIANLPIEQILKRMDDFEMSGCKEAFKERVEIIQTLAKREGMTVGEIDLRLTFLSKSNGRELALSTLTTQQIIDQFLSEGSTSASSTNTLNKPKGTHEAA